jgi:hypothetical protein
MAYIYSVGTPLLCAIKLGFEKALFRYYLAIPIEDELISVSFPKSHCQHAKRAYNHSTFVQRYRHLQSRNVRTCVLVSVKVLMVCY